MLGMTRGEIILVAIVFALVYGSSFLPKIAQKLAKTGGPPSSGRGARS